MTLRSALSMILISALAQPIAFAQKDNAAGTATVESLEQRTRLLAAPRLPAAPEAEMPVPLLKFEAIILQIDDPGDGTLAKEVRNTLTNANTGAVSARKLLERMHVRPGLTILGTPTIACHDGKPGTFFIGDERKIQYMVPAENGLFRLATTNPARLGMEFTVTGKADQSSNRIVLDPVELTLFAIEGREQLAETDLPIGKPRITRRSVSTSAELAPGQFGIVELRVSDTRQVWVAINASLTQKTLAETDKPATSQAKQ